MISLTPSQAAWEATVVDCSDDSHWLAYKLDGSIEDNTHGGQRHVEAIVENDGGVWRVTKLAVLSFRS